MAEKVIHGNSEVELPETELQKQAKHCMVHLTELWKDDISAFYYIKLQLLVLFLIRKYNMGKGGDGQDHLSICRYFDK